MSKVFLQLWQDEAGVIVTSELVLIATILVIGMVVGLHTVRNAVIQELGDVAMAIGAINQSYSWAGATGHSSTTAGSFYEDLEDFCDEDNTDADGAEPACIDVSTVEASHEG